MQGLKFNPAKILALILTKKICQVHILDFSIRRIYILSNFNPNFQSFLAFDMLISSKLQEPFQYSSLVFSSNISDLFPLVLGVMMISINLKIRIWIHISLTKPNTIILRDLSVAIHLDFTRNQHTAMNIRGILVKPRVAKKLRGRWTTNGESMVIMVLGKFCLPRLDTSQDCLCVFTDHEHLTYYSIISTIM